MAVSRQSVFFQLLLNTFHPALKASSLRCLPQEEMAEILSLSPEIANGAAKTLLADCESVLKHIHYSWFIPIFQSIPENLQPLFRSLLPSATSEKLKHWFPKTITPPSAPPVREFFLRELYQKLDRTDVLPLELLPASPLSPLGDWDKEQLIDLIDYLGIYDLAAEVRRIIARDKLKKLMPCLSPQKRQFLQKCLVQPDKIAVASLEIDKWDGDCKKLIHLLHKRGLARLSKAFAGQHPDLIWHIVHALDTGRGTFLQKHISQEPTPGLTKILVQQVTNLMSFLK